MNPKVTRSVEEPARPQTGPRVTRATITVVAIGAWFFTQALLESRGFPEGIVDKLHVVLTPATEWLASHSLAAKGLLIVTSGLIDLLGCFLFAYGITGRSIRPLLGLMLLFILRQISQVLTAMPPPDGMIWEYPGVPSLFVTYGTRNDFFFSGHTAIAVYGAIELARFGRRWLTVTGTAVALIEALTVLVLRAHYTMDVFTGILAAAWASSTAAMLTSSSDRWSVGRPTGPSPIPD